MTDNREPLGRAAFGAHVSGLAEQGQPPWQDKPPAWEELSDVDHDFYLRIGAAVAEKVRADAEAKMAEVRRTIAAFFTHHGNSAVFALQSARDLAEGIRQVLDRAALEPLSAVCTGPDCGEQFADSETGEYLFATRERMERLLYADGWASDPVLCPACQEEAVPVPADPEAAGQPKLPGVA